MLCEAASVKVYLRYGSADKIGWHAALASLCVTWLCIWAAGEKQSKKHASSSKIVGWCVHASCGFCKPSVPSVSQPAVCNDAQKSFCELGWVIVLTLVLRPRLPWANSWQVCDHFAFWVGKTAPFLEPVISDVLYLKKYNVPCRRQRSSRRMQLPACCWSSLTLLLQL